MDGELNMKALTNLSIDQVKKAVRVFLLRMRIKKNYRNLEHFKRDMDEAHSGAKFITKLIVNDEAELKDLERFSG